MGENKEPYVKKIVITHIGYLLVLMLYIVISLIFDIGCPIRRVIRVPCPACGISRAWYHALRLEFRRAFEYHPLFFFIPVFVLFFIHCDMDLRYTRRISKKARNLIAAAGTGIIFAVYIYRIINGFGDV